MTNLIKPSRAESELIKPRLPKNIPIRTGLTKTTLMKPCHAKAELIKTMLIKTLIRPSKSGHS